MRVTIVGGGVAGLSAARALSGSGAQVTLLEREAHFCSHSSGRNAAMYRPLERHPAICELAQRSASLLDAMCGERSAWLDECGMILSADGEVMAQSLLDTARATGVDAQRVDGADILRHVPHAPGLSTAEGVLLAGAGVLDIHRICTELEKRARAAGAQLRRGCEVRALCTSGSAVTGVELSTGQRIESDYVVVAAGAWSRALASAIDADLPLVPHRRHLVQLVPTRPAARAPIVWHQGPELYFRNEGDGVLVSPCDHEPFEPCEPTPDERVLYALGARLATVSPLLATASVRRAWACLRTLSSDGQMVVGPDPRAKGLCWLSGLAGHGMSAGVAAGDVLVDAVQGRDGELTRALAADRFLSAAARSRDATSRAAERE